MRPGLNELYYQMICKNTDDRKYDLNMANTFIDAEPY